MLHYAAAGAPSGELRGAPVIGYEDEQTGAPLAALAVHRIRCGLEGATVAEGLTAMPWPRWCAPAPASAPSRAATPRPIRPGGVAAGTRDAAGLPGAPRTGASRADQSFLQFLASRLPAASTPRAASD